MHYSGKDECCWWLTDDEASPISVPVLVGKFRLLRLGSGFRAPKVYQPRARRACLGELIQIDGSDHWWFEERAPPCTLLVYVDHATSRQMLLHFTQTESTRPS